MKSRNSSRDSAPDTGFGHARSARELSEDLLRNTLEFAKQWESDRNRRPVCEFVERIGLELNAPHVPTAYVDPGGGKAPLVAERFNYSELRLPYGVALVKVEFTAGRHGIRNHDGEWTTFPSLEQFSDRLEREGPHRGLLQIRIPDASRADWTITIVQDVAMVLESAFLLSELSISAPLLVTMIPKDGVLSDTHRQFLAEVIPYVSVLAPVAVEPTPKVSDFLVTLREIAAQNAVHVIDVQVDAAFATAMPLFPFDIPDEILALKYTSQRLGHVIGAVQDKLQKDIAATSRKKAMLEHRANFYDTNERRDGKALLDNLRQELEDELSLIQEELEHRVRANLAPNSPALVPIQLFIGSLENLEPAEEDRKSIRLTIPLDFTVYLRKLLSEMLDKFLLEELHFLRSSLSEVAQRLNARLISEGLESPVQFGMPDEARIRASLQLFLNVENRVKGELSKPGFMQILSGGRQKTFMLGMTLQLLLGGFLTQGTNVKKYIMPFLGLFFVVAVVGSIWSAKKDREDALKREIEKVKDALLPEVRRILSEVQRDKSSRFSLYFSDLKKRTVRRLEETLKEEAAKKASIVEREHGAIRNLIQSLQITLKLLEETTQVCAKLGLSTKEADGHASRALAAAISATGAAPAPGRESLELPREETASGTEAPAVNHTLKRSAPQTLDSVSPHDAAQTQPKKRMSLRERMKAQENT